MENMENVENVEKKEKTINWSHFATRSRKVKGSDKPVYDRIYTTIKSDSKDWVAKYYGSGVDVYVFILGVGNNVAFLHKAGEARVVGNKKAGARARELTKWYAEQAGADIEWVEDLPTREGAERSTGASKYSSLEALMDGALTVDLDF